tara:strand:+ start:211 stop:492 length:282 start_codon:yes stop_codon:yes gene_type:complete
MESEIEEGGEELDLHKSVHHFLLVGGFVYFGSDRSVLQVNALTLYPTRMRILLDGPYRVNRRKFDSIRASDRMCKVRPEPRPREGEAFLASTA